MKGRGRIFEDFRSVHLGPLRLLTPSTKTASYFPMASDCSRKTLTRASVKAPRRPSCLTMSISGIGSTWHFYAVTYATQPHQQGCAFQMLQWRKWGENHKTGGKGKKNLLQFRVCQLGPAWGCVILWPRVITNSAPGSLGHQKWCGQGNSPSAGEADIWCEEEDNMRLIEGLMRKPLGQTLSAAGWPLWPMILSALGTNLVRARETLLHFL